MRNIFTYLYIIALIAIISDKNLFNAASDFLGIVMIAAVLGWLILSFIKRDFGVDQNPDDDAVENDNIRRKFYDIM